MDSLRKTTARELADAILAALTDAGYAVVRVDDVAVERVARAIHGEKMPGHTPECLYEHHEWEDWPIDRREEYADPFTGTPRVRLSHFAWRRYEKAARAAIAAMKDTGQ